MLLTEFCLIFNWGLKLGSNLILQGEIWKKLYALEHGFILREFMQAFKPGIEQENKGNKAENHPGHDTGLDP